MMFPNYGVLATVALGRLNHLLHIICIREWRVLPLGWKGVLYYPWWLRDGEWGFSHNWGCNGMCIGEPTCCKDIVIFGKLTIWWVDRCVDLSNLFINNQLLLGVAQKYVLRSMACKSVIIDYMWDVLVGITCVTFVGFLGVCNMLHDIEGDTSIRGNQVFPISITYLRKSEFICHITTF